MNAPRTALANRILGVEQWRPPDELIHDEACCGKCDMRTIEVPDEFLDLLKGSRLGERSEADQVKTALAIHLFQEGLISIGRAAALAEVPRVEFEWLLVEMGIPVVRYDVADHEVDKRGIAAAEPPESL